MQFEDDSRPDGFEIRGQSQAARHLGLAFRPFVEAQQLMAAQFATQLRPFVEAQQVMAAQFATQLRPFVAAQQVMAAQFATQLRPFVEAQQVMAARIAASLRPAFEAQLTTTQQLGGMVMPTFLRELRTDVYAREITGDAPFLPPLVLLSWTALIMWIDVLLAALLTLNRLFEERPETAQALLATLGLAAWLLRQAFQRSR